MYQAFVWYFSRNAENFGDVLNKYVFKNVFNTNLNLTERYTCDGIAIGSVIDSYTTKTFACDKPLTIWGSGFLREPTEKTKLYRPVNVIATRGKLTKYWLEKITGQNLSNVILGDPGLLTSLTFKDLNFTKTHKYGIIPHYADKNEETLNKIKLKNSKFISPLLPPDQFVKELVSCEIILSSAMHGLIAADSFNIPNIRFIASDNVIGGDFKFNDYYSVFNITEHNKIDLREIDTLEDINFTYTITKNQVTKIQNDLIRSFPYAKS